MLCVATVLSVLVGRGTRRYVMNMTACLCVGVEAVGRE